MKSKRKSNLAVERENSKFDNGNIVNFFCTTSKLSCILYGAEIICDERNISSIYLLFSSVLLCFSQMPNEIL